ncbi:MAG: hypothetical protein H7196_00865 [candidate division SR1 bacterium]|nr:hypothetical protein [candidate division SR1 bacterium]
MTNQVSIIDFQKLSVDQIVKHLIDSKSASFEAEGLNQYVVFQVIQHADFPVGIKVNYPD